MGVGGMRLNLCGVSTRLPGVAQGRAGQGRAWLSEMFPLPKSRVSAAKPPKPTSSPPWHTQAQPGNWPQEATEQFPGEVMAIWHQGKAGTAGRHKEKLRAAAPLFLLSLPFSRRIHEKSVQGQTQPPGSGVDSTPPGRGDRDERRRGGNSSQKEGQNATETAQR